MRARPWQSDAGQVCVRIHKLHDHCQHFYLCGVFLTVVKTSLNLNSKDVLKKKETGFETRWKQFCHFETEYTKDFENCVSKLPIVSGNQGAPLCICILFCNLMQRFQGVESFIFSAGGLIG